MAVRTFPVFIGILLIGCSRGDVSTSSLPMAIRLLSDNKPTEALAICEEILSSAPNDYQTILLRGEACEAVGNRAGARASYERALQLRPVDSEPRYHLNRLDADAIERLVPQFTSAEFMAVDESAPEPYAETPEELQDGEAYRRPANQQEPANEAAVRTRKPTNSLAEKLRQAIAVGQKKDREAKSPPLVALELRRHGSEEQPESGHRPVSITRFDLGMGFNVNPTAFVSPPATTGQRRALTGGNEGQRLLAGQAIRCVPMPHADNCRPRRSSLVGQLAVQGRNVRGVTLGSTTSVRFSRF